jgi:hypothetical protein
MISTLDSGWVQHKDHIKALTELENRKMVGQAIVDYITNNQLQYESITLMALLNNWKKI